MKRAAPLFHRWELALDIALVAVLSAAFVYLALDYFDVLVSSL